VEEPKPAPRRRTRKAAAETPAPDVAAPEAPAAPRRRTRRPAAGSDAAPPVA
jgi:hypothetical protein